MLAATIKAWGAGSRLPGDRHRRYRPCSAARQSSLIGSAATITARWIIWQSMAANERVRMNWSPARSGSSARGWITGRRPPTALKYYGRRAGLRVALCAGRDYHKLVRARLQKLQRASRAKSGSLATACSRIQRLSWRWNWRARPAWVGAASTPCCLRGKRVILLSWRDIYRPAASSG